MMGKNTSRNEWMDSVRGIACLMVITLHVSAGYLYAITPTRWQWLYADIINSFTRSCVPLFFMISGYIFIKLKDINIKNFLRLIYCIIFYSFICSIYLYIVKGQSIIDSMTNAYKSPVMYHLWFFYSLLVCYFFFIFFSFKFRDLNIFKVATALLACFLVFNYSLAEQLKTFNITLNLNYTINAEGAFYIFYSLIGALAASTNTSKIKISHCLFLFITSSLLIAVGTRHLSIEKGYLDGALLKYNTLLVSTSSLSAFIMIKNHRFKNAKIKKIIALIANISLPMYGTHVIFVEIVKNYTFVKFIPVDFALKLSIVLIVSIVFSIAIKRIDRRGYVS